MGTQFKDPLAGTPAAATCSEYGVDNSSQLDKARRGVIFEQSGLFGIRDINGTVLFPAEYSFIGRCQDYVIFLKPDGCYQKLSNGCNESGYMDEEERPFVENGKAGFKVDGKIIIPAMYDFITPTFPGNYSVFTVTKDGREYYINEEGREVLTRVKRFEGEEIHGSPFWLCSNCDDYYTALNYVGHRDDSNPNVVKIDGEWIELDRFCWSDILGILVDQNDDLPLDRKETSLLLDSFSYEYSFYFANSNWKDALRKCMDQFERMHAFSNSWYFTAKIIQAPGEFLPAKEIRRFYKELGKKDAIDAPELAVGHSEMLKPGEVRVLLITYYNEHCFPPRWEFEWHDKQKSLAITALKSEVPALREKIDRDVLKKSREDDFRGLIHDCLLNLIYEEDYDWGKTKEALEYFRELGSGMKNLLCEYSCKALSAAANGSDKETEFFLRAAGWAMENDSRVNCTSKSKTVLDIIRDINTESISDEIRMMLESLQEELIKRGAVTFADRLSNEDYFKELYYIVGR